MQVTKAFILPEVRTLHKQKFEQEGIIVFDDFLPDHLALSLHRELAEKIPWELSYLGKHGLRSLPLEKWEKLPESEKQSICLEIEYRQQQGFQFLFCSFPLGENLNDSARVPELHRQWIPRVFNDTFTAFIQELIDDPEVTQHNLQAAYYPKASFLMPHDDKHLGVDRRCAFILQLTKHWDSSWGGQLEFLNDKKKPIKAIPPTFNSLTIFRIPSLNQVSKVSESCKEKRLSLHGWCF